MPVFNPILYYAMAILNQLLIYDYMGQCFQPALAGEIIKLD
jgi:hypothetical protein